MRYILVFLALSLCFGNLGCGDESDDANDSDNGTAQDDDTTDDDISNDDVNDDDDDDNDDDDNDDDTPPPGCDTLIEGLNEGFVVDGVERFFYLSLPDGVEESWPWPVVFNWHGYGASAVGIHELIKDLVSNADFPFIAVSPGSTRMLTADWDLVNGLNPNNREVKLFEEILDELDTCFGVDWDHVHGMGFSFGGSVAKFLAIRKNDVMASIATYSGGYASNPANKIPYAIATWPSLEPVENKFVEMQVHGGLIDWMILPMGIYAENDLPYLNAAGHDVIECRHNFIHTVPDWFMPPAGLIEFFADHPYGTEVSPYAGYLPDYYPGACFYSPKD